MHSRLGTRPVEGAERAPQAHAFLTFYAGRFATPRRVERSSGCSRGSPTGTRTLVEISRGMGRRVSSSPATASPGIFWRRWNELMDAA